VTSHGKTTSDIRQQENGISSNEKSMLHGLSA